MDAERLLAEERVGWRELTDLLGSLEPERLEEPNVTDEGWSPKDVMFHVGGWLAEAGLRLEQMRAGAFDAGNDPSGDEIERMNRSWFESSRQMDTDAVRAMLEASHARMLDAWNALQEKTPDAWSWFDESGPRHYAKHVSDLRAWIARVGP
jgi:hypothetical protein